MHGQDVSMLTCHLGNSRLLTGCGAGADARAMLRMVQAKGAGYAISRQQELETMQHVAHATGVPFPYKNCICYCMTALVGTTVSIVCVGHFCV